MLTKRNNFKRVSARSGFWLIAMVGLIYAIWIIKRSVEMVYSYKYNLNIEIGAIWAGDEQRILLDQSPRLDSLTLSDIYSESGYITIDDLTAVINPQLLAKEFPAGGGFIGRVRGVTAPERHRVNWNLYGKLQSLFQESNTKVRLEPSFHNAPIGSGEPIFLELNSNFSIQNLDVSVEPPLFTPELILQEASDVSTQYGFRLFPAAHTPESAYSCKLSFKGMLRSGEVCRDNSIEIFGFGKGEISLSPNVISFGAAEVGNIEIGETTISSASGVTMEILSIEAEAPTVYWEIRKRTMNRIILHVYQDILEYGSSRNSLTINIRANDVIHKKELTVVWIGE